MSVRVWGAVMTEDGPVAEVRDLPDGLTLGEIERMDPSWRVWRIEALPASREGHSAGPACIPEPAQGPESGRLTLVHDKDRP